MARKEFLNVLVLADGSERGFRAAERAIALARIAEAKLTVMSVIDTETLRQLLTFRILASQEMTDFEAELEVSARQYLDRVRKMAMDEKVVAEQVLVKGPYHTAVLAQQKQLGADLIVIPAFKSRDATRDLLAREYQKILDDVPCPVMLVK
jgi:nucleotide-binding universal stress UspA family protein